MSRSIFAFSLNEDVMTTLEAPNVVDLDKWRKCPELTVDDAMNLILGFEPGTYSFDYENESSMPPDAVPIYRKLIHDIRKFELRINLNGIDVKDESSLYWAVSLSGDESPGGYWWHDGRLLTIDLRGWIQKSGFPCTFFEIKPANAPAYMDSEHEMYSTKLAAAVKAWEHFAVNGLTNPKKTPKQNIEAWLIDNANHLNLLYNRQVSKLTIEEIAKIVNWKPEGGAPKS